MNQAQVPTADAPNAPDRLRQAAALLALALLLSACFGDGAEEIQDVAQGDADTIAEYPEWIDYVYPPPGSESSATKAVQVRHSAVTAQRQVRLTIDGIDVTTYAIETSPGLLEYDDDAAEGSPVPLDPGEHEAVVELFRVTPGASEGVDSYDPDVHGVIDTYTWEFTVL